MNYSRKAIPRTGPPKQYKKPEQITVKACMEWFAAKGFSMNTVESKAVYSHGAGRYLSGQTVPGFSDSAGCTPNGIGCFVEFKAHNRQTSLRDEQRAFLLEKIRKGAFACVVDSSQRLEKYYAEWFERHNESPILGVQYLLDAIPRKKTSVESTSLF